MKSFQQQQTQPEVWWETLQN